MQGFEKFVCRLYDKSSDINDVGEMRWKLFTKKQVEGELLPPTRASLKEAILRAHYQEKCCNC